MKLKEILAGIQIREIAKIQDQAFKTMVENIFISTSYCAKIFEEFGRDYAKFHKI